MTRSSLFGAAALAAALGMITPTLAFAQEQPAQAQAATYTDAQVSSFAAAATEINPIVEGLQTATPEQQTQAVTQIREILQRNNIDEATYNGIATQAQTDTALQARIAAASTAAPAAAEAAPSQQN